MDFLYSINDEKFYYNDYNNNKIHLNKIEHEVEQHFQEFELHESYCTEENLMKLICKVNKKALHSAMGL